MRKRTEYSAPTTHVVIVDTDNLLASESFPLGEPSVDGAVGAKRHNFYDDNRHEDNPDGTIEVPHLWDE